MTMPLAPFPADREPGLLPGAALRQHLIDGKGRLLVILATSLVWVLDALLVQRIEANNLAAHHSHPLLGSLERISTLAFIIVTVGLGMSLYRPKHRSLFAWSLTYLVISMAQVIANVMSMVGSGTSIKGGGLTNLWDVAAVYAETVIVFMFVYIFLDVVTPGGAFIWPSRDGEDPPMPHLIDYLFISLNVNSTYGPTSEVPISRTAKMFMALQVLLAILMLTVLIARAVSA
jgi:hypothetical protein